MNNKQLDKFIIGCLMFSSLILIWNMNIQFTNERLALIDFIGMSLMFFFMYCVIRINNKYNTKNTTSNSG